MLYIFTLLSIPIFLLSPPTDLLGFAYFFLALFAASVILNGLSALKSINNFNVDYLSMMGHTRSKTEEQVFLEADVKKMCAKLKMPQPTIMWADNVGAVVMPTPDKSGLIILGKKTVKELSSSSVMSIVVHELAHLVFNHTSRKIGLKMLCDGLTMSAAFGTALLFGLLFRSLGLEIEWAWFITVPIYTGLVLIALAILKKQSRAFEIQADELAVKIISPEAMIQALEHFSHVRSNPELYFPHEFNREKHLAQIEKERKKSLKSLDPKLHLIKFEDTILARSLDYWHDLFLEKKWLRPFESHPPIEARVKHIKNL